MKTAIALILLVASATCAMADVYVHGYTRRDGTYVQSHHRSNPDGIKENNYSYRGY